MGRGTWDGESELQVDRHYHEYDIRYSLPCLDIACKEKGSP